LVQKAIAIIDKLRTFLEVPTFWWKKYRN
jgi:hypothetical protein